MDFSETERRQLADWLKRLSENAVRLRTEESPEKKPHPESVTP
jgi:hypothetical protein